MDSERFFAKIKPSMTTRVTKTAVYIEAVKPMSIVTANPRIGPYPKLKSTIPAIIVVKLESKMALKARL